MKNYYDKLRMIENIKKLKEMEIAYKENLKLCKYQEQQINKLATCISEIKEIAERGFKHSQCNCGAKADLDLILQKISEVENG